MTARVETVTAQAETSTARAEAAEEAVGKIKGQVAKDAEQLAAQHAKVSGWEASGQATNAFYHCSQPLRTFSFYQSTVPLPATVY